MEHSDGRFELFHYDDFLKQTTPELWGDKVVEFASFAGKEEGDEQEELPQALSL